MQKNINLSIQMPKDNSSLLEVHADTWSGDSPYESVVWLPLVDCYRTKTMFLLPPLPTNRLHQNFSAFKGKSSEELFSSIEPDLNWIEMAMVPMILRLLINYIYQ